MTARVFGRELLASLVVFLVALPLCMGIAIASGASPAAGLVSGIIGGLVVGSLAGVPLQVSGPAAGLVVLVAELLANFGVAGLAAACVVAGAVQIAAGRLKFGRWFKAVAPAVIYGMLAGIGVLIMVSQLHVMVDDAPRAGGLANLLALPEAFRAAVTRGPGPSHHLAAAVGTTTLVALIGWNGLGKLVPRLSVVPAPLVAIVAAVAITTGLELPIRLVELPDSLAGLVTFPGADTVKALFNPAVVLGGLGLALVASAESLLCGQAVDKLHDGPRGDLDKELVAQGVGNAVAGLLGALPVTGVIVRSTANIESGARTRWSAVLHAFWLLGLIALAPGLLELIPTAALAAILVYIGYKLVKFEAIKQIAARGRAQLVIYLWTVVTIVGLDLLTGLAVGAGLSLAHLAWRASRLAVDTAREGDRIDLTLRGAATFMSLPLLSEALEAIEPQAEVHVHLQELDTIDHACLDLLSDWERQRERQGGSLHLEWAALEQRFSAVA